MRIFKQSNSCLFKVYYLYGWKNTTAQLFSQNSDCNDPAAILAKRFVTLKAILHLPDIVTDLEDYRKEWRKIMVDPTLPLALVEKWKQMQFSFFQKFNFWIILSIKWKIFKIYFVLKSRNELYFQYTDLFSVYLTAKSIFFNFQFLKIEFCPIFSSIQLFSISKNCQ